MPAPALDEFQIGWICALPIETAAAQQMLDENFGTVEEQDAQDTNIYTLGRINKHYIVIACLGGQYGTTSATIVANNMMRTFSKSLRIGLMVGIGGGIPSAAHDIRLGDIVVSYPTGTCGGVLQYDMEKSLDGEYTRTGSLNSPPRLLLGAVNMMKANMLGNDPSYPGFVADVIGKNARTRRNFGRPDKQQDRLFKAEHRHPPDTNTCEGCHEEWKVIRDPREDDEPQPHYGIIASGNSVIKDALRREQLRKDTGALCFEMEAAGLMQDFPCIVIRGICDYADSHKNKQFQGFAALVAAAYTKELLQYVPRGQVSGEKLIADISGIVDSLNTLGLSSQQTNQKIEDLRRQIDFSKLPTARDAVYGAYANQHEPECLPGTRTEIQNKVTDWATSPASKCVFWLNGMAGTGKSTISRTVVRSFKEKEMLGASFFFKKGEGERGNATRFVSTISTQLTAKVPELIPFIRKVIDQDAGIAQKSLQEQFDQLLLQPLLRLQGPARNSILVVVIDALDECDEDKDIRHIIRLLPQLQECGFIRLRIFLTSRPELPIRLGFKDIAEDHQFLVLHEMEQTDIEYDISLFLEHRLAEIRNDQSLPLEWPGSTKIQKLATMSTPLFIFAATVCRILEDRQWNSVDSLNEILAHQNEDSRLNGTYLPILNRLFIAQSGKRREQLIAEYRDVIGAIVMLESPLSAIGLSKLLSMTQRFINIRLDSLHSVLHIPRDDTMPVRLFHLSFRDFLLDVATRERTPLWIDGEAVHEKLTTRCLETLRCHLRRNICDLPSYGTERKGISTQVIDQNLPSEVQYACRYWAQHLVQSRDPSMQLRNASTFIDDHFYNWIEAMSILGFAAEVVRIINILQTVVLDNDDERISTFLYDSKRFMLKNAYILDIAPLQLYSSGLIFAPRSAIIREKVEKFPSWICSFPQVEESWSADFLTLEGHSDIVHSAAFSPDGRLLASVSEDTTIKIWDVITGALQKTVKGDDWPVQSVLFSRDGQFVITGSISGTIRFWDVTTGALYRTLEVSSKTVYTITAAISPDGQVLATASERIKLWDVATGALRSTRHEEWFLEDEPASEDEPSSDYDDLSDSELISSEDSILQDGLTSNREVILETQLASGDENISDEESFVSEESTPSDELLLKRHIELVHFIKFSPNGNLLASSSKDANIYLWNIPTGAKNKVLTGHADHVDSVDFSPDGQMLASGSGDGTIKLWDVSSGTIQNTFLVNRYRIKSVTLSLDGKFLVSGSSDSVIRLWDISTGNVQQTLKGHGDWVYSITISRNGQLLASTSADKTIKLWDISVKSALQDSGHLIVQSVDFSPDEKLLASGSADGTVIIWCNLTGCVEHILMDSSYQPQNKVHMFDRYMKFGFVKFSPNGQILASGTGDGTIKLWNTTTGSLQQILNDESGRVISTEFSSNGCLLLSGSTNKTATLWDVETGTIQRVMNNHLAWVDTVAISTDGRFAASGSEGIIRVLSLRGPVIEYEKRTLRDYRSAPPFADRFSRNGMAFSPNGKILAIGYMNLQLLNTFSGEEIKILECGYIFSIAFSSDSELLASSSPGGTIKLWEIETGALLQSFHFQGKATDLTFSRHSPQLFTNLGSINVHPWYSTDTVKNVPEANFEVFLQDNQWITINGENVLWLPPEWRPVCSAFRNGTLALGHESGRVSLMRFQV
ncbi:putative WD-repeat protein [Talaromyces proteolyticus]|uniref:WD-repeat protein n=1 Tax=Talaromyces proteolyticus TaxID=1131652 RepID=A0AAD4Q3X6_9EURO|nr:putative WD-repeat protein [Talaromyces proteolyticus]KAH8705549.1 putative WD-repeat protein [Talaromyces proteolyticus]